MPPDPGLTTARREISGYFRAIASFQWRQLTYPRSFAPMPDAELMIDRRRRRAMLDRRNVLLRDFGCRCSAPE
jgi:hypothetical protein